MNFLGTALEQEQIVIGCCIDGGRLTSSEITENIPVDAFNEQSFRRSYIIIKAMLEEGAQIDLVTFTDRFLKEYETLPQEVIECMDKVPFRDSWRYYAEPMMEKYQRNLVSRVADDMKLCTMESDFDAAQIAENAMTKVQEITAFGLGTSHRFLRPHESAHALTNDVEHRFNLFHEGKHTGILTGFLDLDEKTDGLQRGDLFVIGARPSQGKTALGLNISEFVSMTSQIPVAFFSLEMSAEAILRRVAASRTGLSIKTLRNGNVSVRDMEKLTAACAEIRNSQLHIVDCVKGINVEDLVSRARGLIRKHGIQLVVIDYLQKIISTIKHEKRTYEVGQVSSAIKALASSEKVAVVACAQLNRESDKEKGRMPRISDLADSAQIERDADCITLLKREEEGRCTLLLAKQRDGETGNIPLVFDGVHCRFQNAAPIKAEPTPYTRIMPAREL